MKIVLNGTISEIKEFISQIEKNSVLGHLEHVYYPECLAFASEQQKVQVVVMIREDYLSFDFVASPDFNKLDIKLCGSRFSFQKKRFSKKIERLA